AVLDEGLARFPFALGLRRLDAVLRAGLRDPAAMAAADALSLDYPGEPEAWFALGETANLLGEFARAKEAFERALELAPRGPFARRAKDRIRALEALHRAAPGR
ncbi:MAG: tetratricopeptide repeat protein, partial [Planctomycetota bacterium]